jgi:integrase
MSTKPPSRADISSGTTLADVITAIGQADLADRRRQELKSAVRTVAKALDRRLDEVPADPRLLANRLAEVAPVTIGLSPGRWANVRSLLRAAISLIGKVGPGRHRSPLSPSWKMLWDRLPTQTARTRLSRFMHFASIGEIEPATVTAETFATFRAYLDTSLLKDPDRVYCATIDGWRAARAVILGWPDLEIARPNRHVLWALPLASFPESFQRDLHAWLDRISGDDLMSDGPMRPVRPITRQSHAAQIRRFASAVVLTGRDAKTITSLADLTTIDAFTKGLTFLLRQRANKPTGVINIAGTLKAIARHHVGVEQHHLEQMARIIRRIGPRQQGLTQKNRARLRPLDDPQTVGALLDLPTKLMDLASRERRLYKAALLAQTSVAIEILEMTLMRMRNLVGLDIEKHLHRARRNCPLHIVIEGDESKNHAAQEYPLPPQSVELIDRYLAEYRPFLADPGNSALFPGKKVGAKHANTLAEQIKSAVWTHVGLRWNPHLFRHAEAKLYLDQNPGGYGVPQRVLGHRSDTTTTKFYAGQETAAAVRHFDQTILKLRARVPLP